MEMFKKNIYRLCNIATGTRHQIALCPTLIKRMKVEVFYCKSDIHVRLMRFCILCTPTDSSDKTQLMYSTELLCLFVSKYDINGSKLNYSTSSSNKFK